MTSENIGPASGPWKGYYCYSDDPDRHRMDIDLTFGEGTISGAGIDDVGRFGIRGRFDAAAGECHWKKTYGTHDVFYKGIIDGRGIWGTWDLPSARGGFHIRPKGVGEEEVEAADAAEPAPVDAVAEPAVARARYRRKTRRS